MRARAPLAALLLLAAGCGQGGPSQAQLEAQAARRSEAAQRRALEAKAPEGASPTLRALYAKFPRPKPDPDVEGSGQAIRAGERACAHSTPLAVKARYYAQAKESLSPAQRQAVERLGRYEAFSDRDPSFAAGQLAATVYAATLAGEVARYGYRGCVYGLVRRLEGELGGGGGG